MEKIAERRELALNTPQPSKHRRNKLVKRVGGTPATAMSSRWEQNVTAPISPFKSELEDVVSSCGKLGDEIFGSVQEASGKPRSSNREE